MKEALERIRVAEEKNAAARQSQEVDLTQLRTEKEQALAQEKTSLEQEAQAERQSFQKLYEERHEALVNEIIERVTSTYGG